MYIFLARNNVQAGPYSLEQLNQMLASGQVLLTDLMWHEGMQNWQTVNEMTAGQFFYRPANDFLNSNDENLRNEKSTDDDDNYIINNTPTNSLDNKTLNDENVWDRYNANNPHKPQKNTTIRLVKKPVQGFDVSQAKKQINLASLGSRILAKLIDTALMILASLPLFIALYNSPSFDKLKQWAQSGQATLTTSQQVELLSVVPQHILLLTNFMVWGLLIAQTLLLMRRGQTLGKMMMGIRILDRQSNAIPSFFNLIIMRSLLTTIAYSLSIVGLVIMTVDFVMMLTNKDRQSLHDKIAKTYVVRADDTQTTPLELKPE